MTAQPGTYHQAIAMTAAMRELYVLRDDGAVFILFKRGDLLPDGDTVRHPRWTAVPAVPGTIAALEQEGRPG